MSKLLSILLVLFALAPTVWAQEGKFNTYQQTSIGSNDSNSNSLSYDFFANKKPKSEAGLWVKTPALPNEFAVYDSVFSTSGFIVGDGESFSLFAHYEGWGRAPSWLRVEADWRLTEHFAFGVIHQKRDGTGPRGIFYIPNTPINIWAAPVMFGEGKNGLVGLDIYKRF